MSAGPSIIATLGLDRGQFKTESERTKEDLVSVSARAKETAAAVALLERQQRDGAGSPAMRKQLSELKSDLRAAEKEMKLLEAQKRRLDAVLENGGESGQGKGDQARARAEQARARQEAKLEAQRLREEAAAARAAAQGEHGGHGKGNQAQLAHSGRATLEMIMAGQSLSQAAQVEAPRVVQAFGGGLGTMLGVGAGIAVLNTAREQISEVIDKAHEMKSALIDSLRPAPTQGASDPAALRAQVRELDGTIEESAPKLRIMERLWQSLGNSFSGASTQAAKFIHGKIGVGEFLTSGKPKEGWDSEVNAKLREEAEARRADALGKIVVWEREANSLKAKGFEHGQESVQMAELELEKKQKLAKIEEDLGIAQAKANIRKVESDPTIADGLKEKQLDHLHHELAIKEDSARKLQAEAQKEFDLREQEARRSAFNAQAAVDLEARLVAIKKEGLEVDVLSAKARLDYALAILHAGPKAGAEHDKNQAGVDAALFGVTDSEHQVARHQAQRQMDEDLADDDAPEPVQQRRRLDREKEILQDQVNPNSDTYERDAEKRKDLQKEIAQKDADLRALDRSDADREFARRDNQAEATRRPGTQGTLDYLDSKALINADRQQYNRANLNDPDKASELSKEAADLARQKAEILRTEQKSLRVAKEETSEMELRQSGHTRQANEARIIAGYEEQILEALRNGNLEMAEQLRKKKALALVDARIERELMSPEQRAAEDQKERDHAGAARRVKNRDDRRKEANATNAAMDPIGAAQGLYQDTPRGREGTKAYEAPENAPADFARLFHKVQVQPDMRATATADPQQAPASSGGFNDGNIVSAIKETTAAVKGISHANR